MDKNFGEIVHTIENYIDEYVKYLELLKTRHGDNINTIIPFLTYIEETKNIKKWEESKNALYNYKIDIERLAIEKGRNLGVEFFAVYCYKKKTFIGKGSK